MIDIRCRCQLPACKACHPPLRQDGYPMNFTEEVKRLEAEIARLEREASAQYQAGFDAGRKESAELVREQGRFLPWDRLADAIWSEPQ